MQLEDPVLLIKIFALLVVDGGHLLEHISTVLIMLLIARFLDSVILDHLLVLELHVFWFDIWPMCIIIIFEELLILFLKSQYMLLVFFLF